MISEISRGLTPLSSARFTWYGMSLIWLRAIIAASVTMLRSRGARLGRFHTSPSSRSSVYFSSAGATVRISSRVGIGATTSDLGMADAVRASTGAISDRATRPVGLACEHAQVSTASDRMAAASGFMGAAPS